MIGVQTKDLWVDIEKLLPAERERLVRLCAFLTGEPSVAEDLAQETLVEAWRNSYKLYDLQGFSAWLSAIARHVCLRWARSLGRELKRFAELDESEPAEPEESSDWMDQDFDLEIELERDELAALLDRALNLLPAETRQVLVERYFRQSSLVEAAQRLGISPGTATVRLHRGRLALRRVLADHFPDEMAAYGLVSGTQAGWQETRIWCPVCGKRRLLGRLAPDELLLRCPACDGDLLFLQTRIQAMFKGVKGYRAALNRVMKFANSYYRTDQPGESVTCSSCGGPAILRLFDLDRDTFSSLEEPAVFVHCPVCQRPNFSTLRGLALDLPEGQRFWRLHDRIQSFPVTTMDVQGRPAHLIAYQSLAKPAQFRVAFDRQTYRVLAVYGGEHG